MSITTPVAASSAPERPRQTVLQRLWIGVLLLAPLAATLYAAAVNAS